jgi:Helicase associated domain
MSSTGNKKRKEPDTLSEEDMSKEALLQELKATRVKLAKAEAFVESLQSKAAAKKEEDDEDVSDGEDSVEGTDMWSLTFKELRQYRIVNGTCNLTKTALANQKLSKWILNQRFYYANTKNGKQGQKITQERIRKLDSIGFSWGKKYPDPVSWNEMFEALQKFQKAMGHCRITVHPNNPTPLASWVTAQRVEYKRYRKGRDSLLTLEQIGQLREIGFQWKSA